MAGGGPEKKEEDGNIQHGGYIIRGRCVVSGFVFFSNLWRSLCFSPTFGGRFAFLHQMWTHTGRCLFLGLWVEIKGLYWF